MYSPIARAIQLLCCLTYLLSAGPALAYESSEETLAPNKPYLTQDGRFRVVGYNDMDLMLTALAGAFSKTRPDIRFDFILKGTRTAPGALMDDHSAFAPMGAEFQPSAMDAYMSRFGAEPTGIRIAHSSLSPKALSGPLALFVHPQNPLESVSMEDARRVFGNLPNKERIRYWGELGLQGKWARRPIRACGLRPGTALANFLQKHGLNGLPYSQETIGFRQSLEAIEYAGNQPEALCFAAYNRAGESARALAVSGQDTDQAVPINRDTIINDHYPLTRHLYVYIHDPTLKPLDPVISEFLRFILSQVGQNIIAAGPREYLPLNEQELKEQRLKLP